MAQHVRFLIFKWEVEWSQGSNLESLALISCRKPKFNDNGKYKRD
jgi:hypothetical protein